MKFIETLNTPQERKITLYLAIYLCFQLVYNFLLFIFLFLIFPLDFSLVFATLPSSLSTDELEGIWIICFVFSIVNILIDCIIGWRWVKQEVPLPTFFNWFFGYLIFIILTGVILVPITLINQEFPTTFFFLLGFIVLPTLAYFYASYGLMVFFTTIFFSDTVGEAAFFLAIVVLLFFYIFSAFLLTFPLIFFYVDASIGRSKIKFFNSRIE